MLRPGLLGVYSLPDGFGVFDSCASFGSPRYVYANSRLNLPVDMGFLGSGFGQFAMVSVLCMFELRRDDCVASCTQRGSVVVSVLLSEGGLVCG